MSSIVVRSLENGPNLILVDGATVGAFCRCGLSAHKPKCDGSHQKIAFQAPAAEIKITE